MMDIPSPLSKHAIIDVVLTHQYAELDVLESVGDNKNTWAARFRSVRRTGILSTLKSKAIKGLPKGKQQLMLVNADNTCEFLPIEKLTDKEIRVLLRFYPLYKSKLRGAVPKHEPSFLIRCQGEVGYCVQYLEPVKEEIERKRFDMMVSALSELFFLFQYLTPGEFLMYTEAPYIRPRTLTFQLDY